MSKKNISLIWTNRQDRRTPGSVYLKLMMEKINDFSEKGRKKAKIKEKE